MKKCALYLLTLCIMGSAIDLQKQSLRLSGGRTINEGRLEIYHNSSWHGICNNATTDNTARDICHIMGYNNGIFLLREEFNESDSYAVEELECDGGRCSFKEWGDYECEVDYIVELACGDLEHCKDTIERQFTRTTCLLEDYKVTLCPGSNTSTYRMWGDDACYFSNICNGTAGHYQACGCSGVLIQEKRCQSTRCLGRDGYLTAVATKWICDGYYDCLDMSDEVNCQAETSIICEPETDWQSTFVPHRYQCDSDNDCMHGEDELNCGHDIGIYCNMSGSPGWADKSFVCDNITQCDNGTDELECDWSPVITCEKKATDGEVITLNQYEICKYPVMTFVEGVCKGYTDQMNCSYDNSLTCTVNSFTNTRVRKNWLCQSFGMCDDHYDDDCITYIDKCKVHKLAECDDIPDCTSGEDEFPKNIRCNHTTPEVMCQRKFMRDHPMNLSIPLNWLCDGVEDCVDGEDEDLDNWLVCGDGDKKMCLPKSYPDCHQGFICPDKEYTVVQFEYVCDYEESCGGSEIELCSLTKSLPNINTEAVQYKRDLFIPPCIPGLLNDVQFTCVTKYIISSSGLVAETAIHMMKEKVSCKSRFGEQYLLLASHEHCIEPKAISGLTPASESNCSGSNIVMTLDSHNFIRKLLWSDRLGQYLEHVFVCANQKCVAPDKYCNLIDDCGDGSDEENCVNSFKCGAGSPKYIRADQMCNAQYDCFDGSDECNSECKKENIIDGPVLKIAAVIIGIASTFINIYMIAKGIINRQKLNRRVPFTNQLFVSLIAVGDFCVGIYLLNIVVIDYLYRDNYCEEKYEWLTSPHCSFLGVLTTFGSQLSLFSMVVLSTYRAASMGNLFGKSHLSIRYYIYIFLISIILITVAILIALVPILDITEDYFTNGMYYKNNTMFNRIATLDAHRQFLKLYTSYRQNITNENYSWRDIRSYFNNYVFTRDYPGVIGKNLKFYGNAGVCLFKWFVNRDDSQRQFTLCVISLNLACFVIITGCYGHIIVATQKSRRRLSRSRMDEKRGKKLQTKISLIIVSDFLCWIPFCLICLLHTLGIIDAYRYYQVSSIILIPINSCINPIIYSNATSTIWSALRKKVKDKSQSRVKSLKTLNFALSQLRQSNIQASSRPRLQRSTATISESSIGNHQSVRSMSSRDNIGIGKTVNAALYLTVATATLPSLSVVRRDSIVTNGLDNIPDESSDTDYIGKVD